MSETDIGNAAGAGEDSATDDGADEGKHFWGSIRGVITAVSGLVVALAGLITVLGNIGLFGGKAGGEAEDKTEPLALETPAEAATPAPAPAPSAMSSPTATAAPLAANEPAPAQSDTRMFRVSSPSDGWVAIRARATVSSEMLGRLEHGTFVRCGRQTPDATGIDHRFWRYCPEVRGYMAERLLRRTDD